MRINRLISGVVVGFGLSVLCFGQGAVSTPAKRQSTLELASRLLASPASSATTLPADLVDPFNPPGFGTAPASGIRPTGVTHAKASDADILEQIASRITPSGMVLFNGEPILLFREKRLKVGDNLTITFEGTDYVVVISAIEQNSFKIRLNREEITRPIIKPGKAP